MALAPKDIELIASHIEAINRIIGKGLDVSGNNKRAKKNAKREANIKLLVKHVGAEIMNYL